MLEDESASEAFADHVENMERTPEGIWRTMPGVDNLFTAGGAVMAMAWFQPRPHQRWLVFEEVLGEATSRIRFVTYAGFGGATTITTRSRVSGRPAQSAFFTSGRWLYHFNGLDHPIRWDGDRVVPVGFRGPVPQPVVLGSSSGFEDPTYFAAGGVPDVAGADLGGTPVVDVPDQRGVGEPGTSTDDAPWRYAYGLTLENDLGQESHMSALAFAQGVNEDSLGLRMVRLQVPALPANVMRVHLWRSTNLYDSLAALPDMYRLASFDGAGGFDFADHTPDGELGELHVPNSSGPVPAGVRAAAMHHESLWVAVDNAVYRSGLRQIETFPPGQRYTVGGTGAGSVVALHAVPRGLVVLCTRGVFMVKGNPLDGYRVEAVSERVEAVGPRAMAFVDGLGLVILTTAGPMLLSGVLEDDQPTRLSPLPGIRRTWRRLVNTSSLFNAVAVHRPEVDEVWFHVPRLGETRPSLGLVLHYGGDGQMGWSRREGWDVSVAVSYLGRTWLGTWGLGSALPGLWLLTRGQLYVSTVTANTTPSDPSVPEDTGAVVYAPGGGAASALTTTAEPIVGVYESGLFQAAGRVAPSDVEIIGHPTGHVGGLEVQVRYDRQVHYVAAHDEAFIDDVFEDHPDTGTQKRPVWNTSVWDEDAMWVESALGAVRVPLPGEREFSYQIRIRGPYLRLAALRLSHDLVRSARPREEG